MRWKDISALIVAGIALLPRASDAAPAVSLEYSIKATFLYKFAPFVEWPLSAFESPSSPVLLCVVGTDPVAQVLDGVTMDQTAGERRYQVRRLERVERDSGCHVLYVADSNAQSAAEAMEAVRGAPVLTVTDAARTQTAAIVRFVVEENRVRFDIDDAAAAENGLSISSRLLSLARTVRRRP
jgi:YfiR/HmsC-like